MGQHGSRPSCPCPLYGGPVGDGGNEARRLLRRALLAGGVVGPAAFVGAWLVGGLLREGYDPVSHTISRLAEDGAPTAPLMTAGFVAFGLAVPAYATQLRPTALRVSATVSGLATLGVAATPLSTAGGTLVDRLHLLAAGIGYAGQAASPLLGAQALPRPPLSRLTGAVAAAALVASLLDADRAGLWQRLGLGLVDVWFVVLAVRLLRADRLAR